MTSSERELSHSTDTRSQLKVMVIDDDDGFRDGLQQLLEAEGHSVMGCPGARCALGRLQEGAEPDVIVLDLRMPEMNGWEFRIQQKKEPRWSSIPIVALSGDPSPQAQAIDAAAFLGKPIDERVFVETIDRLSSELQRSRAIARASEVQRLVSLGSLIGGIAHEINNPLAIAGSSVESLQLQLLASAHAPRSTEPFDIACALRTLERTQVGLERIAAVVRCVSLFASADDVSIQPLDVRRVLDSSIQVAANEIRHCAVLERAFEVVPHVRGNPAKLGQVFLNLLLNAVLAIRQSDEREHRIRVGVHAEGTWVVVTFTDTASVLEGSSVRRLFDPLTPVTAESMELHFGLAISREVVESMGGSIVAEPDGVAGANFRVRLPSCEAAPSSVHALKPKARLAVRRSSLMIVDDDALMCEVLSGILGEHYDIVAFTSALAALSAISEAGFDLILCDVMMPELDGMDFYERIVRLHPEMACRFIFITGGAFTERARNFVKRAALPTVQKPFAKAELLAVVAAALGTEQMRAEA